LRSSVGLPDPEHLLDEAAVPHHEVGVFPVFVEPAKRPSAVGVEELATLVRGGLHSVPRADAVRPLLGGLVSAAGVPEQRLGVERGHCSDPFGGDEVLELGRVDAEWRTRPAPDSEGCEVARGDLARSRGRDRARGNHPQRYGLASRPGHRAALSAGDLASGQVAAPSRSGGTDARQGDVGAGIVAAIGRALEARGVLHRGKGEGLFGSWPVSAHKH